MHCVSHCASEQVHAGEGVVSDQSDAWCEILSVVRMLRRILCGHGVVDVGRAVRVLFNRNRNRVAGADCFGHRMQHGMRVHVDAFCVERAMRRFDARGMAR
jgi:hypothetical protein